MESDILFDQINRLTMYFCTFGVLCAIGIVESDFQGASAFGAAEIITGCEIPGPGGNYLTCPHDSHDSMIHDFFSTFPFPGTRRR